MQCKGVPNVCPFAASCRRPTASTAPYKRGRSVGSPTPSGHPRQAASVDRCRTPRTRPPPSPPTQPQCRPTAAPPGRQGSARPQAAGHPPRQPAAHRRPATETPTEDCPGSARETERSTIHTWYSDSSRPPRLLARQVESSSIERYREVQQAISRTCGRRHNPPARSAPADTRVPDRHRGRGLYRCQARDTSSGAGTSGPSLTGRAARSPGTSPDSPASDDARPAAPPPHPPTPHTANTQPQPGPDPAGPHVDHTLQPPRSTG